MTEAAVAARYSGHYLKIRSVYPSVLALKFFLGNNPEFSLRGENFKSKRILDIGFGDGRDLRLFLDLGFEVFGVEVSADVVKHTSEKISGAATLSVGFNNETGYSNDMFDYVYDS